MVLFEGVLLIKITAIYINVVCTQIVPHWGTNRGCGINQVNTVISLKLLLKSKLIMIARNVS